MYRLSHRNIGLLICYYRGSLILGIMHVYLTAHMREGISARPGVTGGVTGSGGTSNRPRGEPLKSGAIATPQSSRFLASSSHTGESKM